jgi:LPXTG-motif cell wall-anchored protein
LKTKTILNKWHFMAVAITLLVVALATSSIPVMAADPPGDPSIPTELKCYGGASGGSWGTYVDIYFKEGSNTGPLPGWCADEYHTIYVGTWYTDIVYDYFGYDYPDNGYDLPDFVSNINWNAIAWILNNDSEYSMKVIQEAFWCVLYPPNDNNFNGLAADLGGGNAADKAAALALATEAVDNHSDFVPVIGKDTRPVICYSTDPNNNQVQVLFFQFGGGTPPPPLPEVPTVVLLGIGLAGITGFVVIRRRKKATAANAAK